MDKKAFVKANNDNTVAKHDDSLRGVRGGPESGSGPGAHTYTLEDIQKVLIHQPRERDPPPGDSFSSQSVTRGDLRVGGRPDDQSAGADITHSNSSPNEEAIVLPDDQSSVSSLEEPDYLVSDASAFPIGMMLDDQMDTLPWGPDESRQLDFGNIDIQDGLGHGYQPSYHNSAFPNHASPARFVGTAGHSGNKTPKRWKLQQAVEVLLIIGAEVVLGRD